MNFRLFTINRMEPKNRLVFLLLFVTLMFLATLLYLGVTWGQVRQMEAPPSSLSPADAAIILGSAVWEGGIPSPSLRARVTEGVRLYEEGKVSVLICSGGLGTHPPEEALVMQQTAMEMGVPREVIIMENQARNTWENLLFSQAIGEEAGFSTYIVVSDGFHLKRASLLAEMLDIPAQFSPAVTSPLYTNQALATPYRLREVVAITQLRGKKVVNFLR